MRSEFDEGERNDLGYRLLKAKKVVDAIDIFRLNVEAYPNSANAYDSLAEAYMVSGDREPAVQNCRKSLELNPRNAKAAAMLETRGILTPRLRIRPESVHPEHRAV